jgi:hypothetical protein
MTALNFWIDAENVLLVSDTLVTSDDFAPAFFTTKIHAVPHWDGVICGTGSLGFILDWHREVLGGTLALDIEHLNEFAPQMLQELFSRDHDQHHGNSTSTVYHFGYSRQAKRMVAFAYRSTDNFQSEALADGLYTKPAYHPSGREMTTFPDDFVELCKEQREAQDRIPIADRVFIGGQVVAFALKAFRDSNGNCEILTTVSRPFTFDDYEQSYQICARNLT